MILPACILVAESDTYLMLLYLYTNPKVMCKVPRKLIGGFYSFQATAGCITQKIFHLGHIV
jgi:hypothetical protein